MPAASEVVRKRRAKRNTARLPIRTAPSAATAYGPGPRPDYTRTTHADRAWLHTPPAWRAAPFLVVDFRSAGFCLPSYLAHQRSGPGAVKLERVSAERSELRSSRLDGRRVAELRRARAGRRRREVRPRPGLVLVVVGAGAAERPAPLMVVERRLTDLRLSMRLDSARADALVRGVRAPSGRARRPLPVRDASARIP
jgi:hypothetical protein